MVATRGQLIESPSFVRTPITTANFMFKTENVETGTGRENRRPCYLEYCSKLELGSIAYENCQQDKLDEFRDYFNDLAKGDLNYFLWTNPLDYVATGDVRVTSSNTSSRTFTQIVASEPNSVSYQLFKEYIFAGRSGFKTVYYPIVSSVKVRLEGVEIPNLANRFAGGQDYYEVRDRGIIQVYGATITSDVKIDFEFQLPYRLDPGISVDRPNSQYFYLTGVKMREVVEQNLSPIRAEDFANTTEELDFGFQPSYSETFDYEHFSTQGKNKRELLIERFEKNKSRGKLDGTLVKPRESDAILNSFIASKGSLLEYKYRKREARFDTDTLTLSTRVLGKYC